MDLCFENGMEMKACLNRCLVKQYNSSERRNRNAVEGIHIEMKVYIWK